MANARQFMAARTGAWAKSGGGRVGIPTVEVSDFGFLDCVTKSVISPPYTLCGFVKQGSNQSTSLSDQPLFFSCGGGNTGSAFGKSGQDSSWNKVFSALNQPRYWCQFNGFTIESNFDWHFVTCVVSTSYSPFSMYVDGFKTSTKYSRYLGTVGTTQIGSHFGFFARTSNGVDVSENSQWRGSVARMSFYKHAFTDNEAVDAFSKRFDKPTLADSMWDFVIDGGVVVDSIGGMNLNVIGNVVQGQEIAI